MDLMDWWQREPDAIDIDYVAAIINDSGEHAK